MDRILIELTREEAKDVISSITRDLNHFQNGYVFNDTDYVRAMVRLENVRDRIMESTDPRDDKDGEVEE